MGKITFNKGNLSATVLKAMSIFGGVQVITIICSIIRTKLVAIWIGAVGVGLFGLYNTAIEMISAITQLGMRQSAVRDIASASPSTMSRIIAVVRRWAWALGLLGAFVTLALSPLLSKWTFGDDSHTLGFCALACVMFLSSITGGELAILQGLKRLRRLARASVWGVLVGLAVSVPLFYFYRIDSIIPSIIAYTLATAVAAQFYREKEVKSDSSLTAKETFEMGSGFVVLGIYMTISAFTTMLISYIFMAYLNNCADTATVGHYQAGFTLVNKYVGLIFTAIAMEYYPRLAQANGSNMRTSAFVSHEMKLVLWILVPVITLFITADDLIVKILYSAEFEIIIPFISWAIVGMIFRATSWCMAFVILSKGDGKIFLLTEISSALVSLVLNIAAFNIWGIAGLGVAYIVWYFIYTLIVWSVFRYRYHLTLGRGVMHLIGYALAMSIAAALLSTFVGWWAAAIIAVVATFFTARRLLLQR